ncbi:MAG: hypothetical protein HYY60_01720 [Parcubacteria group bacterium]|nr:hypothetical protein [Parcubacteria group bacterium]MBI3074847.1 hypothetical protein [Parcubacteria group bacterium]
MFLFKKRPLYSAERTERGKRRAVFLLCGAAVFAIGGGTLLSWVSYRDEITFSRVRVTGAETLSLQEINGLVEKELVGAYFSFFGFDFFNRANSILYPQKSIERKLAKTFPRVASVSVYRINFRELGVKIRERVPSYLWCGSALLTTGGEQLPLRNARHECYFLDPEGIAFAKAPYFSGNVYFEIYGKMEKGSIFQSGEHEPPLGSSFLPAGDFARVISFRNALDADGIPPEKLMVEESGDALLFFPSGLSLKFLLTQDFSVILSNLRAAIDTEPLQKEFFISAEKNQYEFLDARFENRIFYK